MANIPTEVLKFIDLKTDTVQCIWSNTFENKGKAIVSYCFDSYGKQAAFIVQNNNVPRARNELWYYHSGMEEAILKADSKTRGIDSLLSINSETPSFSASGKYILFKLKSAMSKIATTKADAAKVDIWSYKDSVVQSRQIFRLTSFICA